MKRLFIFGLLMMSTATFGVTKIKAVGVLTEEQRELIIDQYDEQHAEMVDSELKKGWSWTFIFADDAMTDGPRDLKERCEVTIEKESKGGGSAKVDGKVVGGEIRGAGGKGEKITVKGPCGEVRKILKILI